MNQQHGLRALGQQPGQTLGNAAVLIGEQHTQLADAFGCGANARFHAAATHRSRHPAAAVADAQVPDPRTVSDPRQGRERLRFMVGRSPSGR